MPLIQAQDLPLGTRAPRSMLDPTKILVVPKIETLGERLKCLLDRLLLLFWVMFKVQANFPSDHHQSNLCASTRHTVVLSNPGLHIDFFQKQETISKPRPLYYFYIVCQRSL